MPRGSGFSVDVPAAEGMPYHLPVGQQPGKGAHGILIEAIFYVVEAHHCCWEPSRTPRMPWATMLLMSSAAA